MKKFFLFLAFIFASIINGYAQWGGKDIAEYKASNGIVYHVGDTITLSRGSDTNQTFVSVLKRSESVTEIEGEANAPKEFNNLKGVIKKLKQRTNDEVYFVVKFPRAGIWNILIEDAIHQCEITVCEK